MFIVRHRKIWYIISILVVGFSLWSIWYWGLKLGTDFSGGSTLEVSFPGGNTPQITEVENALSLAQFPDVLVRLKGESGLSIKMSEITPEEKSKILNTLSQDGNVEVVETNFSNVGPVLGKEAIQKSWISIILVLVAIVLFVAFAFRRVSKPISSWVYGGVTICALLHDIIVPIGAFSILGYYAGFEVDTLFVTALLVILGFSVHDTIVVFDRVRENLQKEVANESFEKVVGKSVSETLVRSVNTSATTLLAIAALYIWGPSSVHHFSLALLIGLTVGTYSSIFVASPLLVTLNSFKEKNKK